MFNSEILEVGIGMAFLFLLVSLICAAIKEWLEGVFKWRAMDLERALRGLLADTNGEALDNLLRHPLLDSLFQGKYQPSQLRPSWLTPGKGSRHMRMSQRRHLPSYIPSAQFATALLDTIARGPQPPPPKNIKTEAETETEAKAKAKAKAEAEFKVAGVVLASPLSFELLRQRVLSAPLSPVHSLAVQRALSSALDYSAGDLEKVKRHVEQWFDASMDRASGWYKRRTQALLFVLGLATAILLNIDAFHVMGRLTLDKALREVAVKEAEAASLHPAPSVASSERGADARRALEKIGLPIGWAELTGGGAQVGAGNRQLMVPVQLCAAAKKGRPGAENGCERASYFGPDWIRVAAGWLVTAFAVTLGAPFWFDVLNKFMVIRSTVKPHEKSPEEASEDRQAGRR